jgi:hypothetical protein
VTEPRAHYRAGTGRDRHAVVIHKARERNPRSLGARSPRDRPTGLPAGEAFGVAHFHRARRSLKRMTSTTGLTGLSVAPGRMVFSFGELTGNIWLLETLR